MIFLIRSFGLRVGPSGYDCNPYKRSITGLWRGLLSFQYKLLGRLQVASKGHFRPCMKGGEKVEKKRLAALNNADFSEYLQCRTAAAVMPPVVNFSEKSCNCYLTLQVFRNTYIGKRNGSAFRQPQKKGKNHYEVHLKRGIEGHHPQNPQRPVFQPVFRPRRTEMRILWPQQQEMAGHDHLPQVRGGPVPRPRNIGPEGRVESGGLPGSDRRRSIRRRGGGPLGQLQVL